MVWVFLSVGVAFLGMAVLSVFAFRVSVAVRGLSRELERTARRLEPERAALRSELDTLRVAVEQRTTRDGVRSS